MAVKGKIRKMFPGGNTTIGSYFLFEYMIKPATNRIFIIKGGPGVGKSTFMNAISRGMVERGYDVEHFHCATDPDSLDGLVIPSLGVALLDGTAPHTFDPRIPGALDEIINLADYWDTSKIEPYKMEIMEINQRGNMQFQTAFRILKQARMAYEQWQWYVEKSIDQAKYNQRSRILVETALEGAMPNDHTAPHTRHLFGSAITPKGILDYKDTLIEQDMKVYTVEGQPGTGVKQMIEQVAKAAERIGLYTEQYHCPIEPDKLDMLIIPAMRSAVVHNSKPYHFEPENMEGISAVRKIDLNACIQKSILEEYEEERLDAELRFHDLLKKGIAHLAKAKTAHGEKERYYVRAMNYDLVEKKRNEIVKQILKYT